ncbi:hypothetical protein ACN2WE_13155 [Streptomyces sp. cg28]|uniref:hypothetical protein n=1 Tax=Streptomyces sp. cg28 TaxID=3403457 RepID=UPI003B2157DD
MKRALIMILALGATLVCSDAGAGAGGGGGRGGPPRPVRHVDGAPLPASVDWSSAVGLADDNTVVGAAGVEGEQQFPVVWRYGAEVGVRPPGIAGNYGGEAMGIGAAGEVAGEFMTEDRFEVPVRWRPGDDGLVEMDTLGGAFSRVTAMNAAGVAAGLAADEDGGFRAVRWDRSGAVTDLGTLHRDDESGALGINDAGVVVGQSGQGSLAGPAVRWDPDGTVTELPLPAGAKSGAGHAVNRAGVIVGEAVPGGGPISLAEPVGQPVRWDADGTVSRLPVPGGGTAVAQDINDSGTAVGVARRPGGSVRPVRWSPDGTCTDLRLLPGDVTGDAQAINNRGYVAGTSVDAEGRNQAVLWHPDGSVTALGPHSNHTVLPSLPASGH